MENKHVLARLAGIQTILKGVHQGSASMSSATKGEERAAFIGEYLSKVLPPIYRFGSGDVTDANGEKSGQLDVVIEYPFFPSLSSVGAGQTKLYLAESIAAAIEVKSNLSNQWSEATRTAKALSSVHREFGVTLNSVRGGFTIGVPKPRKETCIPLFVVGYTGWSSVDTLKSKLSSCPEIYGALIIDHGLYVSRNVEMTGPWALWGLICDLHKVTNSLQSASPDPLRYA